MNRPVQIVIVLFFLIGSGPAMAWDMDDISIHGFASTGYLRSDANNYLLSSEDGSFEFNEVGINFGAELTEDIRVGIQLYSFDLGDLGNNAVKLDWAFIDYEWRAWLGVRAGKIKAPFGLYNQTQDYDMLRTTILLPQGIYTKYRRETFVALQGADLYGRIPLSSAGTLEYDLYAGTTTIEKDGGIAKEYAMSGLQFESGTVEYLAGLHLCWRTPLRGLKLGGDYLLLSMKYKGMIDRDIPLAPSVSMNMPVDADFIADNPYVYIASIEYDYGRWKFAAEYQYVDNDTNIFIDLLGLGSPGMLEMRKSYHIKACYALISCRVYSWLKVATYYSYYDERIDQQSDDLLYRQKDLAFSTRFDINASWLVKLEVHYMDGVALLTEPDNPEGLDSLDKYWMLYAVKTTFNF